MNKGFNVRQTYRTPRERCRRIVFNREDVCWLCLRRVNKKLKPYKPASPELDEEDPIATLPFDLRATAACDPNKTHLVHRYCNQLKGKRKLKRGAFADDPPPLDGSKYHPKKIKGSHKERIKISTSRSW